MIEREKKRAALVKKYAAKRAAFQAIIDDQSKSEEERYQARLAIQMLPRDSSPTRMRNRCALTGRPRGCSASSDWDATSCASIAMRGEIPGLTKASW